MKLLRQSAIIISFWLMGEIIREFSGIPIPGNVIGMVLLFTSLCLKWVKLDSINEVSDFLLSHLAFFFIPAGAGLISCLSVLRYSWIKIVVISLISTIFVIVSTGITIQTVQRRSKNG
ncbi:holin-like protein [Peptoclostridium litorale DSM 5388]|uniref:Putative membrane protein n=1 Tax=Peptoclostridium litorale DSM 5388 TaxID=1121324 RepID=A0A069RHD9_PEPLI|nr:CidA/LrgA family protein [Peptoclostridium litorale]KDR95575.1 putative membrane protein [Peptoclostridium litorale DSM 5388]SIN98594.1 holin-like protein [Peptoclostridium litorale DSM 5388]